MCLFCGNSTRLFIKYVCKREKKRIENEKIYEMSEFSFFLQHRNENDININSIGMSHRKIFTEHFCRNRKVVVNFLSMNTKENSFRKKAIEEII
jgi:diaminopimelate epimerase